MWFWRFKVSDALDLFLELRKVQLQKKPATAELLNWLMALHEMFKDSNSIQYTYPDDLLRTLSILIKNTDDQDIAKDVFKDYLRKPQP
ncbi:hypothetical protein PN36_28110 [Candidatus Thiomargarita nelsonii]|uniref:Uncharacterized protein n=1 Tax=Candidatus Thiomargarita nelsonii TaxID=1003181 RepID=A0A0A6PIV4_9GAMM|nr:hypothetical protein PN36_28110 [Candidatus Thiomargarita nelsonii]